MSKLRLKLWLWAFLVVAAMITAWMVVNRLAALAAYFQRGANPASALHINPETKSEIPVPLLWSRDAKYAGRAMEPFLRSQIEIAYLQAWRQWNLSQLQGAPYGLETYFESPALDELSESLRATSRSGWKIRQQDKSHRLHLAFFSADGSIVAFDDRCRVHHRIVQNDGFEVYNRNSDSFYQVVMMLRDGNWRVHNWKRIAPRR